MRIEQKVSQALARLNNDRYVLSIAVGQRADELSKAGFYAVTLEGGYSTWM